MAEFGLPGILQPGLGLRSRVAGKGQGPAFAPRPADQAGIRRGGTAGSARGAFQGWRSLAVLLAFFLGSAEAQVLATRIWPARDYTRLTLESKERIEYTIFSIKDPERV